MFHTCLAATAQLSTITFQVKIALFRVAPTRPSHEFAETQDSRKVADKILLMQSFFANIWRFSEFSRLLQGSLQTPEWMSYDFASCQDGAAVNQFLHLSYDSRKSVARIPCISLAICQLLSSRCFMMLSFNTG